MGKDGKKGLGMGLGALFGEEYPAPQPEREETAPDLLATLSTAGASCHRMALARTSRGRTLPSLR